MAPRKTPAPARRQLSVETAPINSDPELDSDDLDGGFDPVQAATELKRVIEGHKKQRFAIRKQIEKKYETTVAEIVKRTEKRLADEDKTLARTRQAQLAKLVAAVEAREAAQQAIANKVGRFYDSCANLTSLLETVYKGLSEEARSAQLDEEKDDAAVRE
ncbi:hypothetical protein SPI_04847 [Niveomyces insectorum RCEF 264]|uniref:Uncharacterized protein n=1 Tax=Niveomyces insectorum RCEF 264 TaxID=1081102 RepID=A0A167UWW7_9HYPO|nr:hypothetical protein SPI_04847 [Niveomyces insectorum RCEF 264]